MAQSLTRVLLDVKAGPEPGVERFRDWHGYRRGQLRRLVSTFDGGRLKELDVGIHGWRLLRTGSGPGSVLSVDFTVAKGRAQANFGDVAPGLPAECAVWASDESGWPSSAGPAGEQLNLWLRTGTEVAAPVSGVLGFCASAS